MKDYIKYIISIFVILLFFSVYFSYVPEKICVDKIKSSKLRFNVENAKRNLEGENSTFFNISEFVKENTIINRYPFSLSFSAERMMLPTPIYTAFNSMKNPEKINSAEEVDFNYKIYNTTSQRNIGIGIDTTSIPETLKELMGLSLELPKFSA